MTIEYRKNVALDVNQVIELYKRTSLAQRRPIDKPDVFKKMIEHANLIISAWDGDKLIGMARSLSDFAYVTYLADLVVDKRYQRQGIGQKLIQQTQASIEAGSKIVLLAAPTANDYYPQIGFQNNPRAWILEK
jgi:ribosomal protein S18 acetylase RimI-like enzyme